MVDVTVIEITMTQALHLKKLYNKIHYAINYDNLYSP